MGEPRYMIAFAAFLVVGVGSFAFHGTLLRSMQLLDELPMVWANSVFIYILLSMEDVATRDLRVGQIWALVVLTILMTAAILTFDTANQDVFLLCYGSGVVYISVCSRWYDVKYNSKG